MNNPIKTKLLKLKPGHTVGKYLLNKEHIGAIQAAYFSKRPLLVRGGPGLGKSRLADAIAEHLDWGLVTVVVHYNTVVDDLLYSVDHIERLHKANTQKEDEKDLPLKDFIRPGKIWEALAPERLAEYKGKPPHQKSGTVLLIDEIDKADASLPNALLDVLDLKLIRGAHLEEEIPCSENLHIVVITSNEERLLPMAFIRRCAILDLDLETGDAGKQRLLEIYNAHYSEEANAFVEKVAKQIIDRREKSKPGDYQPGTSEFLDLIKALYEFDEAEREDKLGFLSSCLVEKVQQRR